MTLREPAGSDTAPPPVATRLAPAAGHAHEAASPTTTSTAASIPAVLGYHLATQVVAEHIDRATLACLHPAELWRATQITHRPTRRSYLAGHVLLRQELAAALDVPPDRLRFGRRPCPTCHADKGRPYLPNTPDLEFSLTRTRGLVAVAIGEHPIGIDIEARDRLSGPALARALHPREIRELTALDEDAFNAAVLRCWVRKEAVLKAMGCGIRHGTINPYVGTAQHAADLNDWDLRELALPAGFVGAVAVQRHGIREAAAAA